MIQIELSLEQRAKRAIMAEALGVRNEDKIKYFAGVFQLPEGDRYTFVSQRYEGKEVIELSGGLLLYKIV